MHGWEDNIKKRLREVRCGLDSTDSDQRWCPTLIKKGNKTPDTINAGTFISYVTTDLPKKRAWFKNH